jgi:hypothetical protein
MMDSFVEAQNNLKRMSDGGCVTLFKTWQSHAVRLSFMPMVMRSPGLKRIEAQNARSSSARVPYLASGTAVRQRFERPKLVLEGAGCGMSDLVELVSYHIGLSTHLAEFAKVKSQYVPEPFPTWTILEIAGLRRRRP